MRSQITPFSILLLLLSLIGTTGCGQSSDTEVSEPPLPVASAEKIAIPADNSLPLKDYLVAGIPAHDRNWTGSDMEQAADALSEIAKQNAGQLPRYQSLQSGKLFDRIIAADNLDQYQNQNSPIEVRVHEAIILMQSSNRILVLYATAFADQKVGDSEMIEMIGTTLRLSAAIVQLLDEFLPTLDENDPTYSVRMESLDNMRKNLATVVIANLKVPTESHLYRTSELKRLIGYMQDTYPVILPALPEASRTEALQRLRTLIEDPEMQPLQPELKSLLTAVEKSPEQPEAAQQN
ncbi:hypothetical protein Pan153_36210 [Gimesia panareensis]|uniref:HEAT repeat domain-containing protein n=1 Tax=Gimesia panareensis TaxID=2527978 RepID=A0A518FRN9_9PLAN|nr:hypothetical protein [Gimesia panareensis]QDV18960.1 hypothetical protein Pan153_36210 [Gimesia panareensis]